ncbi:MAG: CdiA family toxin C-terminal domain-containing protein [Candidatus Thiodiazotropha sp.]
MSTANLFTNSASTQSYTAVNSGMDGAQQTEGETLFQQASQSHQPDVLVKRQFEQRNQNQKSKLANEFITSAGREGISQLAATPDGQHALAVVYDHAGSDGRGTMRQVHEEQGNTAVDYSQKDNGEVVAKQSPLGAMPQNQNHLSGTQSRPASAGITHSTSAHNEESLSSSHKELVQQYASVIKKLVVVNHENRVKENGVGNTIYRDIVNTLHSLAGSPMRVNESGQYRSSIQKPTTEKEQFHQLRETGVVLELLMNEPEAQAIFKKEFGEAWDKVSDWGAQEWTPMIAEATVVVGATLIGKKSINTYKISDDISLKANNNNGLGGDAQTKSTAPGGRSAEEPERVKSSEGASSRPVDDPHSDGTMRVGTDAPVKISPNAKHHLANYDGYERAKGIKGAHNQEEFLKAVDNHSNDLVIIDSTSEIEGVTQYRYGFRKQDRAGNYTGEVKEYKMPKTVYDPNVFSDEEMYKLGSQAAKKGYSQAIQDGKTVYTSSHNGIDFRVYLDRETKEITNFHPK